MTYYITNLTRSDNLEPNPIRDMIAGARLCASLRIDGMYYGCRFRVFAPDSLFDPRDMVAANSDLLSADGEWAPGGETVGLAAAYMVMGV